MWLNDLEDAALAQAYNLATLPFTFRHVALMPDAHTGYGMPIGGVLATKGVIIPNAVGVDIGCGMVAIKLPMNRDTHPEFGTDNIKAIMSKIRDEIPVGFKKHSRFQDENLMPEFKYNIEGEMPVIEREYNNALKSLGTLGGGNHFIEIQSDEDTNIWIMVHSGSRNLGKQVADHHNKIAVALNEKYFSKVESKMQLAFLPISTKEADMYLKEMEFCVRFAQANRRLMLDRILDIFAHSVKIDCYSPCIQNDQVIECTHNFVNLENHFNQNVWVHRKGATLAREGTIGIIPGSQGTKSYIVKGSGNVDSFMSCSHGAGRVMGRNQARKTLDLETEKRKLEDQGIVHSIREQKDLDEASGAYKDIDVVMENQKDLIDIVHTLQPLAVIKG
jgi:tRNA-splicing ligase RtcB